MISSFWSIESCSKVCEIKCYCMCVCRNSKSNGVLNPLCLFVDNTVGFSAGIHTTQCILEFSPGSRV